MTALSSGHRAARFLLIAALPLALASGCDPSTTSVNRGPVIELVGPTSGSSFAVGATITFEATATDAEDGALSGASLVWTSDVDGQLGTGTLVTRADLSLGEHTITLTATDSDGASRSLTLKVFVNSVPSASITSHTGGEILGEGTSIQFRGSATDAEDGPLSGGALTWSSDRDGALGTGRAFSTTSLSVGTHTVTLTASDTKGQTGTATVSITVNARPVVTLSAPSADTIVDEGESVTFTGSATDPEDGTLSGGSLVWASNLDGTLGTGGSLVKSDLSAGNHVITLTATDSNGIEGVDSVGVLVNGAPVPTISSPADGSSHSAGQNVVFTGSSTDGESGSLTDSALVWTSSADGQIGIGTSFTRDDLTQGAHTITLTATDTLGATGTATVTITITPPTCTLASPDTDGDRLPDCAETNNGIYNDTLDTGTDPNDADTDDDGINDGDETLGTTGGLDLPAMGTNPLRKDILLEYDWFDDANDCAAHTHRPTAAQVAAVTAAFGAAPNTNPDGTTGINFIHDYGQGGAFTGGNMISDADGVVDGGVFGADYTAYKSANFASNRNGYFHYVLLPHRYNTDSSSSGQASVGGDDMIVSLQCAVSSTSAVANTIMHELGHNLTLRHGGNVSTPNYKPNYNSVMNYKYQFAGTDNNCDAVGNGVLDYSRGTRISLDENNLDETKGVCGSTGIDWNGDTDTVDTGLALDINVDGGGTGDGVLEVLSDFNDWSNIVLTGIGGADFADARLQVEVCQDTPALPPR